MLVTIHPELEARAHEAWWAMLHDIHPMPACVALDMVQDVSGDRREAVRALHKAAWEYLSAPDLCPRKSTFGRDEFFHVTDIRSALESGRFDDADAGRRRLMGMHARLPATAVAPNAIFDLLTVDEDRLIPLMQADDASLAWYRWSRWYARRVLALCRAISEAA